MTIRAAWITSGFSADEKDYRGAAAIHNLARGLSLHDEIELTIFSFYYPVKKPDYKFYGAKVYSLADKENNTRIDKLKIWRRCMKKFGDVHSQKKFDLIHAMWANEPGFVASKLSRKFSLPLLVNICGGELAELRQIKYGSRLKFHQKKFINSSFKQADRIVYAGDYIYRKIVDYYPASITKKTVEIPFGIDEKIFRPASKHISLLKPLLISVASAVPVKSHITLFKAVKMLTTKFPDLMLKVYGRDDKNDLKSMVDEMNLSKNVNILGFIDYEKIPEALNEADIFVSSSLYESQNMSLLEAAFCGLPVISSDTGVAREVTENLFNAGDVEELTKKISDVINRFAEEKQMALNRIPMLKREFSLENSVLKYADLYKKSKRN